MQARRVLCLLAFLSGLAGSAPLVRSQAVAIPAEVSVVHGTVDLDGPWRFHVGDDPSWADPSFDDTGWDKVKLGVALPEQGIDIYSGYGWYRLRLTPQQLSQGGGVPLSLLATSFSVGQMAVYINGFESGHTRGMTNKPALYPSLPFVLPITQTRADGSVVIAVRTFADSPIHHGILDKVQIGTREEIQNGLALAVARQWDQNIVAGMVESFLFLCMAGLGATFYIAQRNHAEYLWLTLLCLSVAANGTLEVVYSLAIIPLAVYLMLLIWAWRIFGRYA